MYTVYCLLIAWPVDCQLATAACYCPLWNLSIRRRRHPRCQRRSREQSLRWFAHSLQELSRKHPACGVYT